MSHQDMHTKEFVVGAVVGSLLGGVAALLTAPAAGSEVRENLCDTYCNLSDKTQKFADRGRSIARSIGSRTNDWTDRAREAVDDATRTVKGWVSEEEEELSPRDLLIGGLIGGVVGAALGFLLAPKSGGNLRKDVLEAYEDLSERTHDFSDRVAKKGKAFAKSTRSNTTKWLNLAQHFVDELTEDAQEKGEDLLDNVKGLVNNKRVHEILDWAQVGYRVWQGLQSKKR